MIEIGPNLMEAITTTALALMLLGIAWSLFKHL